MLRPHDGIVNGVAVTASTGIAGLNIGGMTLHSFAGIGLGKMPVDKLLKQIEKSIKLTRRWRTTKVLIIDESWFCFTKLSIKILKRLLVSMIDATLFDKLASSRRTASN